MNEHKDPENVLFRRRAIRRLAGLVAATTILAGTATAEMPCGFQAGNSFGDAHGTLVWRNEQPPGNALRDGLARTEELLWCVTKYRLATRLARLANMGFGRRTLARPCVDVLT
jgi:hypothetical protein